VAFVIVWFLNVFVSNDPKDCHPEFIEGLISIVQLLNILSLSQPGFDKLSL